MNLKEYNSELYHWGIKGQKWGVRRYQNADGTLTSAGKKRYNDDGSPKKSKHRQKLEAKYREQGMNQENAERAASRRIRTEKILGTAAGMTVAAATAYVISKNVKERSDKIIKAGTVVQRITNKPKESLDRPFFAAYKESDKTRYKGFMGANHFGGVDVHKVNLKAEKDIKVVSRKKAADTFAELYKSDPEFRADFAKSNRRLMGAGLGAPERAAGKMSDRQLRKVGYDAFNIGLVNHDKNGSRIANKFYSKLKEKGYDAVADVNDQKYSGYKSKQPIIVFNKAGKLSVSDIQAMGNAEIAENLAKARGRNAAGEVARLGAKFVSGIAAGSLFTSTVNTAAINNYRREHPNTKLSDKEILKTINGG